MDKKQKIIAAAALEDPLERQISTAAIIATELEKRGTKVVLVGGAAVEFYTVANYLTRDIDFIAARPDDIKGVMTELGFKNEGGTWYLPDSPIVVEFPKGPLDGSWDRVQKVSAPDGTSVNIISIEDILIDRASGVKYWNDPDEWVNYIMAGHFDKIDWDYLKERSIELQCDDIIEKSKKWAITHHEKFTNEISVQNVTVSEEVILKFGQAPAVKDLPKSPDSKTLFAAYAKEVLAESNQEWTVTTNKDIAKKMLLNGISPQKTELAMKQSPHKVSNPYNLIREVKAIPEVKKVLEKSRGMTM